jgi:hypothetical protein
LILFGLFSGRTLSVYDVFFCQLFILAMSAMNRGL